MTKAERGDACRGGSTLLLGPPGVCPDVDRRVASRSPVEPGAGLEALVSSS